ncbi:hypothetical protein SARC_01431 [Sphaeroforma arctica JP610]|uniref:Uncharacterized protein n=1 Tax=Sphaeroforma arctica JP610 TaxID=667725 RepID=A0A0L0GBP8_9EUKA|nr:hypothetical protein SARC_01431 [Sphaeroforma arctica JP610]KNC86425.1 hypothetical protein SARC_01431 [Sphaeroforma arctica JP610]|eukprot:XP_014160327.1 hypothetical protein SARC_01431 [Sphaeroforma arctica JP610]
MFDVSTPLPFVLAISCRHPTAPTVFGVHVKVGRAGKLRVKKHLPMNLPSLGSVHLHTDSVLSDERLTQALESHMCIPTVMAMMYGGIDSHFSTLCVRKPEPPLPVSDSFLASLTGASMNTPATLGAVGTGGLGMNFDLAMPKSDAGAGVQTGLLLASSATTTAQATYPNLIGARMSGDLSLTPGMSLQPNLGNVLGMGDTIPSANSGSLAGGLIDPQAALVQLNEPEIDTTPIIAVGGIENKDSNTAGMEGAGIGAGTDAGTLARGSGLGTDSSVNGTGDVGRISDANGTLGDQNVKGTSHDHKLDTTTDILADSNRKRKREDDGDEHEGSDSKRQTTRPTPGV